MSITIYCTSYYVMEPVWTEPSSTSSTLDSTEDELNLYSRQRRVYQGFSPGRLKILLKIPSSPNLCWEKRTVDIFQFKDKTDLIFWLILGLVWSGSSEKLNSQRYNQFPQKMFARHGIPKQVGRDNAKQLLSSKFQTFAKWLVFKGC